MCAGMRGDARPGRTADKAQSRLEASFACKTTRLWCGSARIPVWRRSSSWSLTWRGYLLCLQAGTSEKSPGVSPAAASGRQRLCWHRPAAQRVTHALLHPILSFSWLLPCCWHYWGNSSFYQWRGPGEQGQRRFGSGKAGLWPTVKERHAIGQQPITPPWQPRTNSNSGP
jgi:hypothetical protein